MLLVLKLYKKTRNEKRLERKKEKSQADYPKSTKQTSGGEKKRERKRRREKKKEKRTNHAIIPEFISSYLSK